MIDGFVALIFGFCAAAIDDASSDVVAFGYQSDGQCVVRMYLGDSHDQTVTINEHSVSVKLLPGGAEVGIDDLRFVLVKTNKA